MVKAVTGSIFLVIVAACSPANEEHSTSKGGGEDAALIAAAVSANGEESDNPLVIPAFQYPQLRRTADRPEDFAPSGWRVEAQSKGDLNRDGSADIALVLRSEDERLVLTNSGPGAPELDTNPRILAVALASSDGNYQLVAENGTLIPRWTDPVIDDPFNEMTINRGSLRVSLSHFASMGSWAVVNKHYTFRWERGGFSLIGFDETATHRGTGEIEETSVNFLTNKKSIKTGSIESDDRQVEWVSIQPRPMLSIQDVGDGLDFSVADEE